MVAEPGRDRKDDTIMSNVQNNAFMDLNSTVSFGGGGGGRKSKSSERRSKTSATSTGATPSVEAGIRGPVTVRGSTNGTVKVCMDVSPIKYVDVKICVTDTRRGPQDTYGENRYFGM